jgi:hypothetical protein
LNLLYFFSKKLVSTCKNSATPFHLPI